jgi:hypothetical protein
VEQPRRFAIDPPDADPIVRAALEEAGWTAADGDGWSLLWTAGEPDAAAYAKLAAGQHVNHVPGIAALARKDRLPGTVGERVRIPETFLLPQQLGRFRARAHEEPWTTWIQKPKAGARGEGVSILASPDDAETNGNFLVQRYLDEPHLIEGRKYTLRRYVLVTSLEPLEAWLYDDGFTKLASRPFAVSGAARLDRFRHLTNPDVLELDDLPTSADNLTRPAYEELLRAEGRDPDALAAEIERLLATTVGAARDELAAATWRATNTPGGCFELLGVDVLVDAELRPWLLECNLGPSLSVEAGGGRAEREERELKHALVRDLLGTLGLRPGGPGGFRPLPAIVPLPRPGEGEPHALRPAPGAAEWPVGDSVVVHVPEKRRAYVLDSVAAYLWAAWREGLSPEEIAAETAAALPESAWRAETDVRNALAEWHARGLAVDGETTVEEPQSPRPRIVWNRERAYRVGDAVAVVSVPDDEVEGWLDAALVDLRDDDATHVDLRVDLERVRGAWHVLAAGERHVCHDVRALGLLVRSLVLGSLATDAFAGTLLADEQGALLLVGQAGPRADLAASWLRDGGACLADDLFRLGDGTVDGALVGIETSFGTTWWGDLPGLDAEQPLLVSRGGSFARMWRPPAGSRAGSAAPRALFLVAPSPATGAPLAATPLPPEDAFRAVLGACPSGRLGRETAARAVLLARSVPAFRLVLPDPSIGRRVLSVLPTAW